MTMQAPEFLFLAEEDLLRIGNATSPRLDNLRPRDLDLFERNGVMMVIANGKGISLVNEKRLKETGMSGTVWKVPAKTPMPLGLGLNPDSDPRKGGHYFICPVGDMTLSRYLSLLNELALHCEKVGKL